MIYPGFLDPEVIALSIPIITVFGGVTIAIVAIFMHGRKKELLHKERLAAMEKGLAIPEEPIQEKRPAYRANRTGGLVMTFIGIALTIALSAEDGFHSGVWGLLPLAIGLGLLVSATMEKKETEEKNNRDAGNAVV